MALKYRVGLPLLLSAFAVSAQPVPALPRLDQAPRLDGILDEPMWREAARIELPYENYPGEGTAAPVATTAWLYEDGTTLYVAIEARDPNPAAIRAGMRRHDNIWDDDTVGIILDTFDDQRFAFGFFVNPLGARGDFIRNETADEPEDHSWNGLWDSAGRLHEDGFSVELAIPLRTLRFPARQGELHWKVGLFRNYVRESWFELASVRFDRNQKCQLCQYQSMRGFVEVPHGGGWQVTPYLVAGREDVRAAGDTWQQGGTTHQGGVDLRWSLSNESVLNATLKPDFSQVEADVLQVEVNNAFALYYPERRPFFLDGAEYFRSPLFNLVHTRNLAVPRAGLKLSGKSGTYNYAVLAADDEQTSFLLPGSTGSGLFHDAMQSRALIARVRRDLGAQSNLGLLTTRREGAGYANTVVGLDGTHWLDGSNRIGYQAVHSSATNPEAAQAQGLAPSQSGSAFSTYFAHRSRDYELQARLSRVTPDFRADLGFIDQVDYVGGQLEGARTWYRREPGWLIAQKLSVSWGDWDTLAGQSLDRGMEVFYEIKGRGQTVLEWGYIDKRKLYAGRHFDTRLLTLFAETRLSRALQLKIYAETGPQIDYDNVQEGDYLKAAPEFNWQVSRQLQLEGQYDYSQLEVNGGRLWRAGIVDLRLVQQFSLRSQLRYIVQYTDMAFDVALYRETEGRSRRERYLNNQLVYAYQLNPHTLFHLGYSDGGYADDAQHRLLRTARAVFAKFSYAFQP
ncbi:MAG TPA: DUF5916 domain-containing protein [Hyphomicrobiales bacterium]|nr:DUF5916 domain-containing protein [Hyphomicrobiales bacterium]